MKRTFLAKRNALLSPANFSWGALALTFAFLMLILRLVAPNAFLRAFSPAFGASEFIAERSHAFFTTFADTAVLAARNEALANENEALASENQAFIKKVASLEALLGPVRPTATGVLAGVIVRPPESPYDTVILASGTRDGIALGMEAFGEGGVPLGIVSAITEQFSRVTLFSAPGMATTGWAGKANEPIIIRGAGAGALQATLSRSAEIAVGDTVFAPGPGMLPIGTIVRIDSDPSSPGITLRIMPKTNPFSLTWVLLRDVGASVRGSFSLATSTTL